MTVDEIMELVTDYGSECLTYGSDLRDGVADITDLNAAKAALKSAIEELVKDAAQSKPNCTECRKWKKQQADNREWIEGVKRGKEIVERLAQRKETP